MDTSIISVEPVKAKITPEPTSTITLLDLIDHYPQPTTLDETTSFFNQCNNGFNSPLESDGEEQSSEGEGEGDVTVDFSWIAFLKVELEPDW
eukprot:484798-Rhodomonas_salina.1